MQNAMGRPRRGRWAEDSGQSFVELALALPVLLLILLGLADFGRVFYYTTIITNSAREGAAYLALNPTTDSTTLKTHVCNATGLFPYNAPSSCPLVVSASPSPYGAGQDANVAVTYQFTLISSYLVDRVFTTDPVALTARATYPGLR